MRAHARENVASWLRQDQLLEHNMPSTKHISFLDPLLLQSDNTTQHSTAQDNTTQDLHKQDTQAYSCRLHILLNASLELHFTKENARTSRAAGRNARTMARRCIRLACSISFCFSDVFYNYPKLLPKCCLERSPSVQQATLLRRLPDRLVALTWGAEMKC